MGVFVKRRLCLLWAPVVVAGLAVYFGSFVHSMTVNGASLVGMALVGAGFGLAVADMEGKLSWARN